MAKSVKKIHHMAKIKFTSLKDMDDPLMGRRNGRGRRVNGKESN